jgi:hypothetical protein
MDVWMITRWVKDNLCSNKEHISTSRMNKNQVYVLCSSSKH